MASTHVHLFHELEDDYDNGPVMKENGLKVMLSCDFIIN